MNFKQWFTNLDEGGLTSDKKAAHIFHIYPPKPSESKPKPGDIKHKPHSDIRICGAGGAPAPCTSNPIM